MCDVKDEALTKMDKLMLALNRLSDAVEKLLVANAAEGQGHGQLGGFGGGGSAADLVTNDSAVE